MGGEHGGVIITVVAPAANMAIGPPRAYRRLRGNGSLYPGAGRGTGTKNIRVLCVRSHAIADAVQAGSYVGAIFAAKAQTMGLRLSSF
jgi:hypothetical protein